MFEKAGVPCGPIYTMSEVFEDPQVQQIGMAVPVKHAVLGNINLVGQGFSLSRTPSEVKAAAPESGEHTNEIMHSLGYSDGELADLRGRGVI